MNPGDKLGHFTIEARIGEGGMGEIYKAFDNELKRSVAIKTIKGDLESDESWLMRFVAEARALAQINDPSITTIYNINVESSPKYIVIEYLEGESVDEYLQNNPIKLTKFLSFMHSVSIGLQGAHNKKIIHRDIKPSNLFITLENQIKILDFGIAKWEGDSSRIETAQHQFVGSLIYSPPEAFEGKQRSEVSDIYSLGATYYYMLTKKHIFNADSNQELLNHIYNTEPRFDERISKQLPSELIDLIYEMLEKDPRDRPQTMGEVAKRLEKIIQDKKQLEQKEKAGRYREISFTESLSHNLLLKTLGKSRTKEKQRRRDKSTKDKSVQVQTKAKFKTIDAIVLVLILFSIGYKVNSSKKTKKLLITSSPIETLSSSTMANESFRGKANSDDDKNEIEDTNPRSAKKDGTETTNRAYNEELEKLEKNEFAKSAPENEERFNIDSVIKIARNKGIEQKTIQKFIQLDSLFTSAKKQGKVTNLQQELNLMVQQINRNDTSELDKTLEKTKNILLKTIEEEN